MNLKTAECDVIHNNHETIPYSIDPVKIIFYFIFPSKQLAGISLSISSMALKINHDGIYWLIFFMYKDHDRGIVYAIHLTYTVTCVIPRKENDYCSCLKTDFAFKQFETCKVKASRNEMRLSKMVMQYGEW